MHPLAAWLREVVGPEAQLTADSRRVRRGDVFLAYPGARHDGRRHIESAAAAGAAAVLWEAGDFEWPAGWTLPHRPVRGLKAEAGAIAAAFYGEPARALRSIGVTGTSGKTSTTLWAAQALARLGVRTALVGTLGVGFPGQLDETGLTTPDAVSLQRALAALRREGAKAVVMEVSSIGLVEGRLNGMHFDVAAFTNLTRDHLDYHGDMDAYGDAKARLFAWPGLGAAVVNLDDAFGRTLAGRVASRGTTLWTTSETGRPDARVKALDLVQHAAGLRFTVEADGVRRLFETPLLGGYNVGNLLTVLGVLRAMDVALDDGLAALGALTPAPGRLEQVALPAGRSGPIVLVDYAHKPDALEKALAACRPLAAARGGRLVAVFGCGGDRDPGKRPVMGEIAARLADAVVLTSDNPRSESPERILDAILAGIADRSRVEVEADRGRAIADAIGCADEADVVLVAGKGHERYQEIAGVKRPFSDLDVAARALRGEA